MMTEATSDENREELPEDSGPFENTGLPNNGAPPNQGSSHKSREVFVWLALLPVILGLLVLCGQIALLFNLERSSADTQSRLKTSYGAWVYDLIPPINIPELIEDIQEDLRAEGIIDEPAPVVTGVFWVPPSPTPLSIANITATAQSLAASATPVPILPTATERVEATNTRTPTPPPTATQTRTPTRTFAPLLPTSTSTEEPPSPTRTPTPPPTFTATAVPTNTPVTPTATFPPPPPPTAVPYKPISPFLDAVTPDGEGCKAVFGYQNDNTYAVSIEVGTRNQLNIEGSPPTSFAAGQAHGAFEVTWHTGGSLIWSLDGSNEEADWCNPQTPPTP